MSYYSINICSELKIPGNDPWQLFLRSEGLIIGLIKQQVADDPDRIGLLSESNDAYVVGKQELTYLISH
jgi:hypothetical protein